jgi:hypothetical protein
MVVLVVINHNDGKKISDDTVQGDYKLVTDKTRSGEPITVTAPPPKIGIIPINGGTVTHTFNVKNTGSSSINLTFEAYSELGWTITSITPTTYALSAGGEIGISVIVQIPYGSTAADVPLNGTEDNLTFYAKSTTPALSIVKWTYTKIGRLSRVAVNFVSMEGSKEPNGTVNLTYDVINTGNAPDTYNITINVQDLAKSRVWKSETVAGKIGDGVDKYINTGTENKYVAKAQIKIPQSVYGDIVESGKYAVATLTAKSVFGGGKGTADAQIVVDNAYGVDLELLSNKTIDNMNQGDTATYKFRVTNTRNFQLTNSTSDTDVIRLQMSIPLSGWSAKFEGDMFEKDALSLRREASTTVWFNVTASPDASVVPCIINVTAYSESNRTKTKTVNVTAQVKQVYRLNIVGPTNGTGIPGTNVSYSLRIDNVGNGEDRFTIGGASNHGWKVRNNMSTAEKSNGRKIDSDKSSYVVVTLEIPTTDPIPLPNTEDILNVTATSTKNGGIYYILITTAIEKYYNVSLWIAPANVSKYVPPGQSVQYVVNVNNSGNTVDNISLEPTSICLNGAPMDITSLQNSGWTISLDTYKVTSERTTRNNPPKSVTITVTPPIGAKKNDKLTFNITATSEGNNSKKANVSMVATVAQTVGVSIKLATPIVYGKPEPGNNVVNISFDVKNIGNGDDNFTVGFLLDNTEGGWQAPTNMNNSFPLSAGGNQTKQTSISIPWAQLPAANTERTLTINVTSEYGKKLSPQPATAYATANVTIRVSQIYGVDLSYGSEKEKEKELLPGGSATYTVTIKNNGNGNDSISLDVTPTDTANWRAEQSKTLFSLGKGENESFTVTITSIGKSWGTDWKKISPGIVNVRGTTHGKTSSLPLTATIVPGKVDAQRKYADPGKRTEYTITVNNVWTSQIELSVTYGKLLPGWTILPNGTVTIPAGKSQDVTIWVTPPTTNTSDKQTQTITVNLKLGTVVYQIQLDTEVWILDLAIVEPPSYPKESDGKVIEGKKIKVSANVNSQYTKNATDISVKFYCDDDIIETKTIPKLEGNDKKDVSIDWEVPLIKWYEKSEERTLWVEVSAAGEEKGQTANNIQSASVTIADSSLPIEISLPILIIGIAIIGAAVYVNRASLQKIKWFYPAIGIGAAMIAASLFSFMWDNGSSLMVTIIFILLIFPLIAIMAGVSTKSYIIPPLTGFLQFISFFSIIAFTTKGIEYLPTLIFDEKYHNIAVLESIPNIGYMILYIVIGLICGVLAIRLWFYAGKKLLILKATIDKIKHME